MFYVPQIGNADCGFACLKMLLANAHHDKQYLHLPCDENHGMYSFRELESIALENGVQLNGFRVNEKKELLKISRLPAILKIRSETVGRHAVLLYRINKKWAYLADPHLGKYRLRTEDLFKVWEMTGLFIVSVKRRNAYIYEKFEPISVFKKIFALILQALSGASLIVAVYFITPDGPLELPIIFVSLSLIFEILLRLYLYKLMNNIDKYFEVRYDDVNSNQYYDYYVRSQNFKKNYLTSKLKLIYAIMVSVFVIFITVFNNPLYFPLIIVGIAVAAVDALVFKRRANRQMQKLSDEEEMLKKNSSREDMIMKVKKLQKGAYDFSKQEIAKKLISYMFFAVTSFLVCFFTNTVNLVNAVLCLAIEIILYQQLVQVFSYEEIQQELLVDKVKLSNIFYEVIPADKKSTK